MEVTEGPEDQAADPNNAMRHAHPSPARKTLAYIRMTRPELGLMAIISVYIGAGATTTGDLLLAMPAVFLITAGSMTFNDSFDREIDSIAHPRRPVPAGVISTREALWFSILLFAAAVAISLFINPWCLALALAAIASLMLYETRFKQRGFLGNLVVAVLSSLAFVFGGAAVGRPWDAVLLSMMAFFIILGREILMDTRDMQADLVRRITLPMRIGRRAAVRVGGTIAAVSIALTPLPVIWDVLSRWYLVLYIPVDALVAYAIVLALEDVDSAGRATDLFRGAMALALAAFYLGIAL